jgi:hypothetical protein
MKWFKELEEGKAGAAFLETRDPVYRTGFNVEDESRINGQFAGAMGGNDTGLPKGTLDQFRDTDIARILGQGGAVKERKEPQVTPLGVVDWEYKNKSYWVQRAYSIETAEGIFIAAVMTIGMESQKGEYAGRQWLVNLSELKVQPAGSLSDLGKVAREAAPPVSINVVANWVDKVIRQDRGGAYQDREGAYFDTLESGERARLRGNPQWAGQLLMDGMAAATAARSPSTCAMAAAGLTARHELANRLYLPGYETFCRSEFLTKDKFETDFAETRELVLKGLEQLFQGSPSNVQLLAIMPRSSRRFWQLTADKHLQLPHDCFLVLQDKRDYDIHLIITTELPDNAKPDDWRILSAELLSAKRRKIALPTPK